MADPTLSTSARVFRNSVWNLIGLLIPIGCAVLVIPHSIDRLGHERFGLVSLMWTAVSFLGYFDLGLGKSLLRELAQLGGQETSPSSLEGEVLGTTLYSVSILGLAAGGLSFLVAPLLVDHLLKVPDAFKREAVAMFRHAVVLVPLVVLSNAFRAILESRQAFRAIALVRTPILVWVLLAPLVAQELTLELPGFVDLMSAGWALALVFYGVLALRQVIRRRTRFEFRGSQLKKLFAFGGWVSVTNVLTPSFLLLDRLVIGAVLSTTAITAYAPIHDVVSRMNVLPTSLGVALFPLLASRQSGTREAYERPYAKCLIWVLGGYLPLCLALAAVAEPLLSFWLGSSAAAVGSPIFRWLLVGVFLNGIAQFPAVLLLSQGHSRKIALSVVCELALYVPLAFWLTKSLGVRGAAISWSVRLALDCIFLFMLSFGDASAKLRRMTGKFLLACGIGAAMLSYAALIDGNAWWAVGLGPFGWAIYSAVKDLELKPAS